jgi:hypothetical protein
MKPVLALMAVEVAQDLEDQGMAEEDVAEEDMAEEDMAEEDVVEEDGAEDDAISKRHSDIRTAVIISSI